MFGLHGRAKTLRIETRARNVLALLPDASGTALPRHTIKAGGPMAVVMPTPTRRLLAAVRAVGVPAALSRDAGRYLCNYLCWRAAEAATRKGGPNVAAFVHVPPVRRNPLPRGSAGKRRLAAGRSGAGGRRYPVRHRFSTALTSAGAKCPAHGPHPPPPHRRRDRRRCLRNTGTCRAAVHIRARCSAFRRTSRRSGRPERRLATRHRSGGAHARPLDAGARRLPDRPPHAAGRRQPCRRARREPVDPDARAFAFLVRTRRHGFAHRPGARRRRPDAARRPRFGAFQ